MTDQYAIEIVAENPAAKITMATLYAKTWEAAEEAAAEAAAEFIGHSVTLEWIDSASGNYRLASLTDEDHPSVTWDFTIEDQIGVYY